jgi:transmembrane sensor
MIGNYNIQVTILRRLNGEASAEEAEVLQNWLKESAANQNEFDMLAKLWIDSDKAALRLFDSEAAWQKVNARIIEKSPKVISIFPWKKAFAVAASVILVVSAFYIYNQPSKISWDETFAQASNKNLQLPDGSVVTLRKGSKLLLPDNFGKTSRQVKLEGEAYFQIKHDGPNPFSVSTNKSFIQDIGTSFLVQSNDSIEQVTVMEGEVSFASNAQKDKEISVAAGESAILKDQKPERKIEQSSNLLAWKTSSLVFDNTPLLQVVNDLENYYGVPTSLPSDLYFIKVTARFKEEPLSKVIEELRLLTGLNFRMDGNNLVISK